MMESIIALDNLACSQDLPLNRLTKSIAYVLVKEVRAKVEITEADAAKALNARDEVVPKAKDLVTSLATEFDLKQQALELASKRGARLEELKERMKAKKTKA